MARLSVRLLGPFQVSLDGEPVSGFASDKVRALVAYLISSPGRPHRREALAGLLWPEYPERSARTNLRNALANLRNVLAERALPGDERASVPCLKSTRQTIQFNAQSDYWLDADAFEGLLAVAPPLSEGLEQAVSLVRGEFLEGFTLADAAPYEEWLLLRREHYGRQLAEALDKLVALHEGHNAYEQALPHARRRVELEPWQENGQRQLMRLLARSAHRSEALVQYERLCRSLEEELGAEPSAETRALWESILSGELAPEPVPRTGPPAPIWNLPAPVTPLFGRAGELARLETKLAEPDTRLVTLTGLGGSGKTRLALEMGRRLAERDGQALADQAPLNYPNGIVFVPLAGLDSADSLVPALAGALGLRLESDQEPVLEFLRHKQLLLIVDNLEPVLASAGFLAEIVRVAPGVKIVATSRERLRVRGEHILPLGGLGYPEQDLKPSPPEATDLDTCLAASPALQLLVDGIQRLCPDFAPGSSDLAGLLGICRLVDGLPLALELAASWADSLSPDDILAEARRSLDFWQVDWADLPERQRSMRAVFDASWRRLGPAEQALFSSLSVFRGGFARDAARKVVTGTTTDPRLLAALVRKSFLQYDQIEDHYQIHELLRQYGAEKLAQEPAREAQARDRHCAYYAAALQKWGIDLKGPGVQAALSQMETERGNVSAAWYWAAERRQAERLDQAMDALAQFYWSRGPYRDGETAFGTAADALRALADPPAAAPGGVLRALARTLAWRSNFSRLRGLADLATSLQRQSLEILEGPGLADQDTRAEKALLLTIMGHTVLMSDCKQGERFYQQSLELFRELGDRWGMAGVLESLGRAAHFMGADGAARRFFQESLAIYQALDHHTSVARLLANLALAALQLGQPEEAERLAHESSTRCRRLEEQGGLAYGLLIWGEALEELGRFAEAHSALEECLALYRNRGEPHYLASASAVLASAKMHRGEYKEARAQALTALALARKAGTHFRTGHALLLSGCLALAEGTHVEAQQWLQESSSIYREIGEPANLGWSLAVSSYAELGLGRLAQAREMLCDALRMLAGRQTLQPSLFALPAAALLLAGQDGGRRAVELYALATRHPFVSESCWFEDLVGRRISVVAATLPPDALAALEERGRAQDLRDTMANLLDELGG